MLILQIKKRETALYLAAKSGHIEVVKVILKRKNVNVNAADNNEETALYLATEGEFVDIVKILIEKGANVNAANNKGETALCVAAKSGHIEVVKVILKRKNVNVNAADNKRETALHWAARSGHIEVVNVLLKREDTNVNAVDDNGETALYWAAGHGHIKVVKALLENGANINLANQYGMNPLSKAITQNKIDVYEYIVKHITELENSGLEVSPYNLELKAEVEKRIFVHNHKPLIDILSKRCGYDVQTRTLAEIKDFFLGYTNDIVLKFRENKKYPIDLVDFEDIKERHVPKAKLHALVNIINQILDKNLAEPNAQLNNIPEKSIIQVRVGERVANF